MTYRLASLPGFSDHLVLNVSFSFEFAAKLSKIRKQLRYYRSPDYATINAKLSSYSTTLRSSDLTRSLEDTWSLFQGKLT